MPKKASVHVSPGIAEAADIPFRFVAGDRRCTVEGCEWGRYDVFTVCRKHHFAGAGRRSAAFAGTSNKEPNDG